MRKEHRTARFFGGMLIYALVFCVAVLVGMRIFWEFIASYEESNPRIALNEYMSSWDEAHIRALSADYVATLDQNICPEEQAYAVIVDRLNGKLSYSKNLAESTEDVTVYVLKCEGEVVGGFKLFRSEPDEYGFYRYSAGEDYLQLEDMNRWGEVSAPDEYTIFCNGYPLDESYRSGKTEIYEELKDFYKTYDLPHLVSYSYGPYIGELQMYMSDRSGSETVYDRAAFLDNCPVETKEALQEQLPKFLEAYINFTGTSSDKVMQHYQELLPYVDPSGELYDRLDDAFEGLSWAGKRSNIINSIHVNMIYRLSESDYLVDVSYLMDVLGKNGYVETDNNAKIIFVSIGGELLVNRLYSY